MFKLKIKLAIGIILAVNLLNGHLAWAENDVDVRDFMNKVINRNDGITQISQESIKSCRYAKKDKKLVCAEKPRIKRFQSVRKDYGDQIEDTRGISIIMDPAAEKGIGFLQYDYGEKGKEADQWMYLSALSKVKRIVSSNENEPKKGSFFGSEFGYEDMEKPHLDDYNYTLIKTEVYRGRDVWVIESVPTPERVRKSNYSKSLSWIDRERLLPLKQIVFDRKGRPLKRLTARKVEQQQGIWVARILNINNLQTKRMSTIKVEKILFDNPVQDDFLTLRTLTDGAFREQQLSAYKANL